MILLLGLFCFVGGLALMPLYGRRDDFFALSLALTTIGGFVLVSLSLIYYFVKLVVSWFI